MNTKEQDLAAWDCSQERLNRDISQARITPPSLRGGLPAALAGCLALITQTGCNSLARSQGKFPIASTFGEEAIGADGYPLDTNLYVNAIQTNGQPDAPTNRIPLVKVASRTCWWGKLANPETKKAKNRSKEAYYMVIDVSNVVRDPSLGTRDQEEFKKRLRTIADMLLMAADSNGEVYWRHLTTFLKTKSTFDAGAQAVLGSSVAASLVNPVVGASLAGTALLADTLVTKYTSNLNVEQYAAMREAASTCRVMLKKKVFMAIDSGWPSEEVAVSGAPSPEVADKSKPQQEFPKEAAPHADVAGETPSQLAVVNDVLRMAYDYAFTYSIDGAIRTAQLQDKELKNLLITGESEWAPYFQSEIERHQEQLYYRGKLTDTNAVKRIEQKLKRQNEIVDAQHDLNLARLRNETLKLQPKNEAKGDDQKAPTPGTPVQP